MKNLEFFFGDEFQCPPCWFIATTVFRLSIITLGTLGTSPVGVIPALDLFSQIQPDAQRNQSHLSELHRKLVEVTTAQEWEDLKKLRSAALVTCLQ